MDVSLRKDADAIISASLRAVLPDEAVRRALQTFQPRGGRVVLVAAGKAAWQMARAAVETLGRVDGGVVITKYGHVKGALPGVTCCEAGHPVPDANGFAATEQALAVVRGLTAADTVLFLLSGGGSALFEQPLLPAAELQGITRNFKLQKLKLRPIEFAEITPLKITDAETGEPGFLLELHNWHENEDRSITVDAALYYNRSGGEFHHLTLTPNGAEYRITGKNSEIIF